MTAYQTIGAELYRPGFLTLLADMQRKMGQVEEAFPLLTEALDLVGQTGARIYEVELYLVKGELTLQQFNLQPSRGKVQGEAETCFLKAIEIARQQRARTLELRATTSLARLWQQQGKKNEAHEMLAEIYGWFTEGFDTKDLQEAKALLAELNT